MPRKLGQHFLQSQSILRRIAAAACPEPEPLVIEIGPGKGALTGHLLSKAERLIAVEIDEAFIASLGRRFVAAENLEIVHADILKADLGQWGPAVVAGNLPYYITSPIIEQVLALGSTLKRAVFLVQKEVADRLTAAPGSRDYGYLTVKTQLLAEPKTLFCVPPAAFHPPPKVDSAVVLLTPRTEPLTPAQPAFLKFASSCFRQKRKNLRNNLIAAHPSISEMPEARLRAEQLSIAELIDLHARLTQ